MTDHSLFNEEDFPHKVSGEYQSQKLADQAVQKLVDDVGLERKQVRVVLPNDSNMGRKIEPEVKGIAKTLVKTHVIFGLAGLALGLIAAALLVTIGPALTRSSPLVTFIAFGFVAASFGLMFAGFISLRPDHDPMIEKTREAKNNGRWTVIAHCVSLEQQAQVKESIRYSSQTL